jgi:hypothetical protein
MTLVNLEAILLRNTTVETVFFLYSYLDFSWYNIAITLKKMLHIWQYISWKSGIR